MYTDDGKRESARYNLNFVMCQGTDTGRDDPKLKACRTTPRERGKAGSFRSQVSGRKGLLTVAVRGRDVGVSASREIDRAP